MQQISEAGSNYFDNVPLGKVQIRFIMIAIMAYFFDQMDLLTFSFVAPALTKHWGVSLEWIGWVNSLTFVGMLFGCWFGGWLSDRIGRKKAFMTSVAIFSLASIANGLAISKETFLVSRVLTGFGVLSMVVVTMVYIVEMLPSESRGKWQGIAMGLGLLSVPLIGQFAKVVIPASPDGWRYVFFVGGSGVIILILAMFWLKESPRWLVSKGRIDEAEKVVGEIIPGLKVDLNSQGGKPLSGKNTFQQVLEIFTKRYIRRTTVLLLLTCGITVGTFMWFAWMPTLLNEYGFSLEDSLFMTALIAFGSPIGDLVASLFSDKGGRKVPLVVYCVTIGLLTMLYGIIKIPMYIIGVGFILRMLVEGVWIFLWTYLAESYPTRIRNTATGLVYSSGRLLTAVAMLVVPIIFTKFGYVVLFIVIGLCFLIPGIITAILGEHTAGRSLEEINQEDTVIKTNQEVTLPT